MKYKITGIFLFLFTCLSAEIIEIKSIKEILPHLDENALVLFDIDDTLMEPQLQCGRVAWYSHNITKLQEMGKSEEEAHREYYPTWIKIMKKCPVRAVERVTQRVVDEIQRRKIKTMGLTHRYPALAEITANQLKKIRIDFTKNSVHDQEVEFKAEDRPIYKGGILFVCNSNRKGEVFKEFMKKTGVSSQKILFIDDSRENLEDVEKALDDWDGKYIGFHYPIARDKDFDAVVAETQFQLVW